MKTTVSEKLEAVLDHLNNHLPIKDCAVKHNIDSSHLKYLISLYQKHGRNAFENKSKRTIYSKETKLKMIKRFLDGETGYSLSLELGSTDPKVVLEWVKLYKEKGEDGIQTTLRRKHYLKTNDRIALQAKQRMIKRNEYLEAENEVLKKWYSLILQRSESLEKK